MILDRAKVICLGI